MFCFCCPIKKKKPEGNNIDQKLIEVNDSPKKTIPSLKYVALSESDRKKQSSNSSQKSLPLSHAQNSSHQERKFNTNYLSGDEQTIGVKPYFEGMMEYNKNSVSIGKTVLRSKGQLFEFEHNTQVVYFDTKRDDEFCLRYLIHKKSSLQKEAKSILNFVLAKKTQHSHEQTQLILVIPSRAIYETKHLQVPSNVHAIFTNMRRLQKNNHSGTSSQVNEIIEGDYGFIKTGAFDKIIVILQGEQDVEYIKNYCRQLFRRYSIDDFLKVWWVFPSFLGLEDISEVIKQTFRKFLINQKIEDIAKYLYYQIDVVKQLNLEPFVLVRNKRWREFRDSESKKRSKDYQSQICLAISLLGVQMNQNVLPYYKYFLENVLFEMKFLDYIKYKSALQNEKENFFKKLLIDNLLTQEGVKVLEENKKMIQFKYENQEHRRFCIKHSAKKKFVAAFGFQESIQTGEGNTPVRQQQWDDNLRLEDLQTRKGSWDKQSNDSPSNNLNLIDEEDIENMFINELQFQGDDRRESKIVDFQDSQPYTSPNKETERTQLDISIFETNAPGN